MKTIEERLEQLESFTKSICKTNECLMADKWIVDAKIMSLHSILAELAAKAGVTEKEFSYHYSLRALWWHDRLLREMEDLNPGLASKIDMRRDVLPEVGEPYPPLFNASLL